MSLLLKITAVQMSLVAAMRVCIRRTSEEGGVNCLRRCVERTRVKTCVNRSLVQALEGCPSSVVTPPAVRMQYSTSRVATTRLCFCTKMASDAISEHLVSKHFLEVYALVLHAYAYIPRQIRHPCNPSSKRPGYGSERPRTFPFLAVIYDRAQRVSGRKKKEFFRLRFFRANPFLEIRPWITSQFTSRSLRESHAYHAELQ